MAIALNARLSKEFWVSVALPLLVLALVVVGVLAYVHVSARNLTRSNIANDLEAIVRLKAGQIEQWQAERGDDANLIITRQFSTDLQQWLAGGRRSRQMEQRLRAQLEFFGASHYFALSLRSPVDGRILLTTNSHPDLPDLPPIRAQAVACVKSGMPAFGDLHVRKIAGGMMTTTGLFTPVRDAAGVQILAVLHLILDPEELLFPLLQTWPGVSASAETQLLRREGDEVVFLNKLRHHSAAPLQLRLPLATPQFIAARVIQNGNGFYEGNDYRGMPSLAYGMAVAGTHWYLIAKIDTAEVAARLNAVMTYSAILLAIMLLASAWWLIERRRKEQALLAALAESEDLYQNAACGYHSLDRECVFVRINDTELRMLGYDREELVGKKRIQDLHTPESLRRFKEHYPHFIASGQVRDLEFEFLRKDGSVLPVLISASMVRDSAGRYLMSHTTVYDISERKRAEQELAAYTERLHQLSTHLQTVREEERARVARELHDELGQLLTALKIDIVRLRGQAPADTAMTTQLAEMTALVDQTIASVRGIAADLRPIMLDELGLKSAVEWLSEDFAKRYAHISFKLACALDDCKVEGEQATAAYRIIQECLTNVVKHAQASKIHVAIGVRERRQLHISVQDNGRGLQQHGGQGGFGLLGMRERVSALGGSLDVSSMPGEGVVVDVVISLAQVDGGGAVR